MNILIAGADGTTGKHILLKNFQKSTTYSVWHDPERRTSSDTLYLQI